MDKKKRRNFRPAKQFRYLPGDVNYNTNMADLNVFNLHRFKVFNAKPLVDDLPLKLNPYKLMPYTQMKDYTTVECEISNENKKLMNKINNIHRNGGKVDSYNPNAYKRDEWAWNLHLTFMQGIVKTNRQIYNMIMRTGPIIKNKEFEDSFKLHEKRLRTFCKYQICVGMKPDYDTILSKQPSISYGLDQEKTSVRPQCFLEFKVRDGPYLGKIFIELYQDFVPVTCQNFMEICKGEGELTYKGCLLHRIVKGKFIETGDITHNNGRGGMSVFGKTFPEEKHVLKHTHAGVVSMKRILYSENNSQFIITLTEMQQWDKMHVVFGKVVKGNSVLFLLEDYGRRIGKPYTDVIISNCGVIEAEGEEREKKEEAEEGEQT
ncbi:unnamed protein product [Phyllotreta striolata]|uniref:PPIase cyclophilin-type domain-containing protein n=1 Tax=Phyllotreta striolata TaxID=444603 RepID=A0A9N9THB0_PHYSR|nr:unnamed protein product [Phyllotreta striolata]